MSMSLDADLPTIITSLREQVERQFHPQLESLLLWLDPNSSKGTRQNKPPTLELKDCINLLRAGYSQDEKFKMWLREYYLYVVKFHFMKNVDEISVLKDFKLLEMIYIYPLQFMDLVDSTDISNLVKSFKHYLIDKNVTFRKNLITKFKDCFLVGNQFEFEYEFANIVEIIHWIQDSEGVLSATDLILDASLTKIEIFAREQMIGKLNQKFIVMETFNKFIDIYWKNLTQLIGNIEDDHDLTNLIYQFFERQFIKIRIEEILTIMVQDYPQTKPTILELKSILSKQNSSTAGARKRGRRKDEWSKKLLKQFLVTFKREFLNPCIPTIDVLNAYVKATKSFLLLDPSGSLLNSIVIFVKPYLRSNEVEMVDILLYALLNLKSKDLIELNCEKTTYDMRSIELLSKELSNDHSKHAGDVDYKKFSPEGTNEFENSTLPYEQVYTDFLNWKPSITPISESSNDDEFASLGKNITPIDYVFNALESKDKLISEFLKLLTIKLLHMKGYEVEDRWQKCLKILQDKVTSDKNIVNDESITSDINTILIMLHDISISKESSNEKISEFQNSSEMQLFPKFISKLYWKFKRQSEYQFPLDSKLRKKLSKYMKSYHHSHPGMKLKLVNGTGICSLNLTFKDGRKLSVDATFEQYTVLSAFHNDKDDSSQVLSINQLSTMLKMDPERVRAHLQFWINKKVLCHQNDYYTIQEYLNNQELSSGPTVITSSILPLSQERMPFKRSVPTNVLNDPKEILHRVYPYINDMFTNLGSLKVDKIHSFLNMSVPRGLHYSKVTVTQLEAYLDQLVEEEQLIVLPDGSFKKL